MQAKDILNSYSFEQYAKGYQTAAYAVTTQQEVKAGIRQIRIVIKIKNHSNTEYISTQFYPIEEHCMRTANMMLVYLGIAKLLKQIAAKKILPLPILTNQQTTLTWIHGSMSGYIKLLNTVYNGFNEALYKELHEAMETMQELCTLVPILFCHKDELYV